MSLNYYNYTMENLRYMKHFYTKFRIRKGNGRRSITRSEKLSIFRVTTSIFRIIDEVDKQLYEDQIKAQLLESATLKTYRLSQKGFIKIFDIVTYDKKEKAMKDMDLAPKYTSAYRKKIICEVKSRYPPKLYNYIDKKTGKQYFSSKHKNSDSIPYCD